MEAPPRNTLGLDIRRPCSPAPSSPNASLIISSTPNFTVIMSKGKLDPLHAVALVSTGSLLIYLPIYVAMRGTRLALLSPADLAVQAIYQGIIVTIVSLIFYARAIDTLGMSGAAAFGALVPALSGLFAIPLLGEWPNAIDWPGMLLVSIGVYLASGGPVPGKTQQGG